MKLTIIFMFITLSLGYTKEIEFKYIMIGDDSIAEESFQGQKGVTVINNKVYTVKVRETKLKGDGVKRSFIDLNTHKELKVDGGSDYMILSGINASKIKTNIKKEKIEYQRNGTYVVMEGPQFSTLAESNLYRSWKADVIGMTNMPEAKLAREAEIRYASVSMVTDYDCWHPDHENVDVQQVIKVLLGNAEKAKVMIKNLIDNFENHIDPKDPTNNCLDVAIITAPEKRTQKTIDKLKNVAGRVLNK